MSLRQPIIWCFILCLTLQARAAQYDFNNRCQKAYIEILNLDIISAKQTLALEKKQSPDNLIIYYLENAIDFVSIIVSEDARLFETLKSNKDTRIELLESGDQQSPYYRYCLAEVYLQWATSRILFDEYVTAAYEINKAYRLLEKNRALYPSFIPNLKSLGLLHALIGTIPNEYRWVVKIIGADGTIDQGLFELALVLQSTLDDDTYSFLQAEALFFTAYVSMNLKNDKTTVEKLIHFIESKKNLQELAQKSALVNFGVANLYIRTKTNPEKGLKILSSFEPCSQCLPFPYRHYALGMAHLNRLDTDTEHYFKLFLKESRGRNYIKSAYQKLAWYALTLGDTAGYTENMKLVKTKGYAKSDDDIQALHEAENNKLPHSVLLKARLLFDGGYLNKALGLLQEESLKPETLQPNEKTEYHYRIGRIYDEMGKEEKAIQHYAICIEMGEKEPWYYAANASFQTGLIYENKGDKERAAVYFKKAMHMKNTEYKSSIDQKAKAGLSRVKH